MDQEITNNQNNLSFKEKAIRYYNNNKILILSFFFNHIHYNYFSKFLYKQ